MTTSKIKLIAVCATFLVAATTAAAINAQSKDEPVQVLIMDVRDQRAPQGGDCSLTLQIMGDATEGSRQIVGLRLEKAEDDTGKDLRLEEGKQFDEFPFLSNGGLATHLRVKLKNPSRNARTIRLIKGKADLFYPTMSDAAKISISGFFVDKGGLLKHPTLEVANIKIAYLSGNLSVEEKRRLVEEVRAGMSASARDMNDMIVSIPDPVPNPCFGRGPKGRKRDTLDNRDLHFLLSRL